MRTKTFYMVALSLGLANASNGFCLENIMPSQVVQVTARETGTITANHDTAPVDNISIRAGAASSDEKIASIGMASSDATTTTTTTATTTTTTATDVSPGAIAAVDKISIESSGVASNEKIAAVTKDMLVLSVELIRFILNYRLEGIKEPRWRTNRYFVAQQSATSLFFASDLISVHQTASHRQNPQFVNQNAIRNSTNCGLIGALIGGSSSVLELGSNLKRELQNYRKGYDARSSVKHMQVYLDRLNQLHDERERLVATHRDRNDYELLVTEGQVLHLLRNYLVSEYVSFHRHIVGFRTFENLYYCLNIGSNSLGASSSIFGLKTLHQPKFGGTAAILYMMASGLTMINPMVSQNAGRAIAAYTERKARRQLNIEDDDDTSVDLGELEKAVTKLRLLLNDGESSRDAGAEARLALYAEAGSNFDHTIEVETSHAARLQKVAIQDQFLAPVIGSTALSQGILNGVAYYKYGHIEGQPALRRSNNLALVGSDIDLCGNAFNLASTTVLFMANGAYFKRLEREGKLPVNLLQQRLEALNQVENQIKSLPAR